MNLKNLFKDDDAVSPVIGVILMVAITVILAAVIASFVLGLGDSQETAPNVSFEFDYNASNNQLDVTKSGGDAVESENLYIRGSNANPTGTWPGTSSPYDPDSPVADESSGACSLPVTSATICGLGGYTNSGEIGAGQGFKIAYGGDADDYEITLVYEDGDVSEELVSDEGPDA